MLMDIPLQVTVELGRTKRSVKEILELSSGSIIELDKLAGEPVDILVNNRLIAKGEVVVIDENFGVRVTDIVSQSDRIKKIKINYGGLINMANRILIVDDAAFMRMMIKDILSKNGYEIVGEAADGVKAVEKYQEYNLILVTMDITMPEMDGITALKEIKKMNPQAKVIMCSAMGQQAMVIDAIQAGAKDFIVKPFQAERVLEAINKALELME